MQLLKMDIHSYKPFDKQLQFHNLNVKYPCYLGGFGGGKTTAAVWEAIDLLMKYPGNVFLITRKTYRELEDSTKKTFFDECPPEFIEQNLLSENKVKMVNGSVALFRSLDDPDKLRSLNLGGFLIDQAEEVSKDSFLLLQGRLRLDNVPERKGIIAANPPDITHWIYELWVQKQDPERYKMIKVSSYDNPYLPKDYIDDMVKDFPDHWVRRFVHGEFGFVSKGYGVFSNAFKREIHVGNFNFIPRKKVYRGWDFGWGHPCCVFFQEDEDDRMIWHKTLLGTRIFLEHFANIVIQRSNEWFPECDFIDFCDLHGKDKSDKTDKTSIDILISKHIKVKYRYSKIMAGVEIINRKLLTLVGIKPAFLVDESNKLAIDMLEGGYCFEKDNEGNVKEDTPYDDNYYTHVADSARYVFVNMFMSENARKNADIKIKQPTWYNNHKSLGEVTYA